MSVSDHDRAEEVSAHGMRYCQDGNSQGRARPMNCRKNESMVIPDEQIAEFIKHWKNAFDETLTPAEARVKAMQLIELYKTIQRCPPKPGGPPDR